MVAIPTIEEEDSAGLESNCNAFNLASCFFRVSNIADQDTGKFGRFEWKSAPATASP
jgi:hypothetical protein